MRRSMRILCHIRPERTRRKDDGKLRPDKQRMRRRLLDIGFADVNGQPVRKAVLRIVRDNMRVMRQRVRATQR